MKVDNFEINGIPAVIYGEKAKNVYLYFHGKMGRKEDGEILAKEICDKGYQVISIDLPGHGERQENIEDFVPWKVVLELKQTMSYIFSNWDNYYLFASSIGAYFSMLAFRDFKFEKALFLSPIVDMNKLITDMMMWAGVDELILKEKSIIETSFGETLDYNYYLYAKDNKINKWDSPTYILYAEKDNLTSLDTMRDFARKFNADLTIMGNGEHYFHTVEQLDFLIDWISQKTMQKL